MEENNSWLTRSDYNFIHMELHTRIFCPPGFQKFFGQQHYAASRPPKKVNMHRMSFMPKAGWVIAPNKKPG
jgi:hypothetical protein